MYNNNIFNSNDIKRGLEFFLNDHLKRAYSIIALLLMSTVQLFAQAWAMHEVAEDARGREPLTASAILSGLIFFLLIFGIYKLFKDEIRVSKKQYRLIRNISFMVFVLASVLIYVINTRMLSKKYGSFYEDKKHSLLEYDSSIQYYNAGNFLDGSYNVRNISAVEIQDFRFFECIFDDTYYSSLSPFLSVEENNIIRRKYYEHPYSDTVYSTYYIKYAPAVEIWNVWSPLTELVNKKVKVSETDDSHLFKHLPYIEDDNSPCFVEYKIRPSRIRYFHQEGDIQYDIAAAFYYTLTNDILQPRSCSQYNNDGFDELFDWYNRERKFSFRWYCDGYGFNVENGAAMLHKDDERTREIQFVYDVVNYGDFEIMYCITDVRFWAIYADYCTKEFLFWEIKKDNWYDCNLTYNLYKHYLVLIVLYSFVIAVLVKLKKSVE